MKIVYVDWEVMSWLCEWCAIFGIFPPDKAWKPDSEVPVITRDGEKICGKCATNWTRAKAEADSEKAKKKDISDC